MEYVDGEDLASTLRRIGRLPGDKALEIAARPEVIFCSFGDMLRVPGSKQDLLSVKAAGGDVRIIYSPVDAVKIAERLGAPDILFVPDQNLAYQVAIKAFEKTTPRRAAQAHFGLAAVFYGKNDYPNAQAQLAVALLSDPSLYSAYLFSAEVELQITGPSAQGKALDLAKKAVLMNPDYVDGWVQVGTYGAGLGKKKELEEAITRVGALAPSSDELKTLQALRK